MINPMDLNDRRFLITGASSGIGREAAVLLSQLGASLILVGRDEKRLKETQGRLEGSEHCIEAFDLNETDAIPKWFKSLAGATGPLNGLIHCAGIHDLRPIALVSSKNLQSVMRINCEAAVLLAKGFRQKGVYRPNSSIIFLASVAGLAGQPGLASYAASKGALIALTRSLAMEFAQDRVRVNCVAPGTVDTEMTHAMRSMLSDKNWQQIESMHPLGIGTAWDIACAIAFLLADTGQWITGTTLVVDGGYTAH